MFHYSGSISLRQPRSYNSSAYVFIFSFYGFFFFFLEMGLLFLSGINFAFIRKFYHLVDVFLL